MGRNNLLVKTIPENETSIGQTVKIWRVALEFNKSKDMWDKY